MLGAACANPTPQPSPGYVSRYGRHPADARARAWCVISIEELLESDEAAEQIAVYPEPRREADGSVMMLMAGPDRRC